MTKPRSRKRERGYLFGALPPEGGCVEDQPQPLRNKWSLK